MHAPTPAPTRAPALVTSGFALLALGALLALLGLSSAELENPAQATAWSTAAFVAGALGALGVLVGAWLGRRA